ncbi:cysteine--tRNA ligase [Propionibacterium freudenreichii]|uniref:cysteine--tRNA ligase n=1 Tax=Propionibacterium freudenreichii TaxID=1744 RepID=UPI00254D9533|nr:cysteine--tRNA ligase [Propionibacterium freudenreichii]MDK9612471.1 cysteine--tRNA ligase [Propionibacterium freudenreichii]
MSFHLYDESSGQVVPFVPLIPGKVSIYHCGLTVQSSPHLGHMRKEVVFDVLRRWFDASGYRVRVVANITDINEKIWQKAAEAGLEWFELAYAVELELHRAYASLGCIPPSYEPRATGHITEMIELINRLIERGHAYAADDGSGDVYFNVRSWPEYGELSHQKIDDMVAATDADPRGKHDPRDFALWKGSKPDEPATASWPSPWGRGRPGWHLECSAMSLKYLGEAFDIHGGGIDLRFPHHENEQAQSRAAGYDFAHYWMHNAFVTMAGEKMSKSLGNGATVAEVTKHYPARAVRLYLAQPHYRSTIEYSDTSLTEATAQLDRIDSFLNRAHVSGQAAFDTADLPDAFVEAMDNDLGTPAAFAVLYDTIKEGNRAFDANDQGAATNCVAQVRAMLHVLGLDPHEPQWADQAGGTDLAVTDGLVKLVLDERQAARERKDFAAADHIRDSLTELGIRLEDGANGTRWTIA